jgi:hypothetical protein
MADIPARVDELEGQVAVHHQVLFGPKDCPDQGIVKQFSEIRDLVNKQTVYNRIMTFLASAVALAVITYVMSLVLK